MYDFAGAWVYRVGMPAKSGVGGGIVAVLPGQLGIAVFSPPLDPMGNSVRGVAVCEALSREFGLHQHRPPLNVGSVVRATYTLNARRSKRRRTLEQASRIDAAAERVRILEAQGPVLLSTAEALIRASIESSPAGGTTIIDFRRVTTVEQGVAALFGSLAYELKSHHTTLVISGIDEGAAWAKALIGAVHALGNDMLSCYADLDMALEACEEQLLGAERLSGGPLDVSDHPVIGALSAAEASALLRLGALQSYPAGTQVVAHGDPSDAIYLLVSGVATVSVAASSGARHRLTTLGPGTTFGELALMDSGPRSADVHADTDVTCFVVPLDGLRDDPGMQPLRAGLVEFLARDLADHLRRANAEIQALAG
jgi:glutaminase